MKKYVIIFFGLLFFSAVRAQSNNQFSGTVLDEKRQPLPGAVITLTFQNDSTKHATTSDAKGLFIIKQLSAGNYHLHIVFLSYNNLDKDIIVTKDNSSTSEIFQLNPATSTLKEVVITARRNFMTLENDKKVFYPNMLSGVASGSASDVMQQIPMVDIDKDGNITLRGKSPQVLIDGKPSPYSDISTALQMISATAIQKIEVMTNPSAKYDAEGQGGVLNIVLKKDKARGVNGVLNLDAGSYIDNHIGTDFNYRKKSFNFFGNINYHDKQVNGTQTSTQHFLQRDSAAYVRQQGNSNITHEDVDSRFGIDYFINDKTSLTLTQGFSRRETNNNASITLDSGVYANMLASAGIGSNKTYSTNIALNTDLNYTHHFTKDGNLLTADLIRNNSLVSSAMDLANPVIFMPKQLQKNMGDSKINNWVLQIDYAGKFGKKGKLEAGYKGSITNNQNNVYATLFDSTANAYNYNQALSSKFNYKESIQALYATVADSILGLNYKLGVRSELAKLNGNSYLQNINFNRLFFNLFPSLYLSKDLAGNQSVGLSYASRISRPSFMQLLPYVNRTNPVSWQSGNLNLTPAYTQNIELNYSKLFAESNNFLNLSVYYTHTGNSIQMVTINEPEGYTLTTPQNIADDKAYGSDVIYRFNIRKTVNFTTTFDVSYNQFSSASLYATGNSGFWNYRIHLEGSVNLPDKFVFLAHGEITGPQILPQGYMNENKGIDVELKRQFFNKKITAAAIVSDIFYSRRTTSYISTPGFTEDDVYKENSRMLHVHLSYSF